MGPPVRTCIGCRRTTQAHELVRVVRNAAGDLVVGRSLPGRGAWLCVGSAACIDVAERRSAFSRALGAPVSRGAISALRQEME